MPNTKSAGKRLRQAEKREDRNRLVAKAIKVKRKAADAAVKAGDAVRIGDGFKAVQRVLDRAADRGYIHKNKAGRLKSRLAKRIKAAARQGMRAVMTDQAKQLLDQADADRGRRDSRRAAAERAEWARLRAAYPGEYVAYIDGWDGSVLTRRVLAHAPAWDAVREALSGSPPEQVAATRVRYADPPDAGAVSNHDLPGLQTPA